MEHRSTSPQPGRGSTSPTVNVNAHHDAINVVENMPTTPSDYNTESKIVPFKNTAANMLIEATKREEESSGPRELNYQNLCHSFTGQRKSMENITELATTVSIAILSTKL